MTVFTILIGAITSKMKLTANESFLSIGPLVGRSCFRFLPISFRLATLGLRGSRTVSAFPLAALRRLGPAALGRLGSASLFFVLPNHTRFLFLFLVIGAVLDLVFFLVFFLVLFFFLLCFFFFGFFFFAFLFDCGIDLTYGRWLLREGEREEKGEKEREIQN